MYLSSYRSWTGFKTNQNTLASNLTDKITSDGIQEYKLEEVELFTVSEGRI